MKKIKDIKFWWILGAVIAAIVIGFICHVVFGFSFWGIALVVCLIWVAEKFAKILYLVAGVMLFVVIFSSYMPQTASKMPWGMMKADLEASKAIDSVQVKADEILEAEKNRQKEALLDDYTKLLKEGKVADARKMMDSIDNLFYPKNQRKETLAKVTSDPATISSGDSVFTKGTYYINVNGETPFVINIASEKECGKYHLESQTGNWYKIFYDNGAIIADGPSIKQTFPFFEKPRFVLKSDEPVTVKMVVA